MWQSNCFKFQCGTIPTLRAQCGTIPTFKLECRTITALNSDVVQYLLVDLNVVQ